MFINPDGSLDRIVVGRYYDRGNGKATLERFTAKASAPKVFGGLRLATKLDGAWNLPEGDLHYVAFEVERAVFE